MWRVCANIRERINPECWYLIASANHWFLMRTSLRVAIFGSIILFCQLSSLYRLGAFLDELQMDVSPAATFFLASCAYCILQCGISFSLLVVILRTHITRYLVLAVLLFRRDYSTVTWSAMLLEWQECYLLGIPVFSDRFRHLSFSRTVLFIRACTIIHCLFILRLHRYNICSAA